MNEVGLPGGRGSGCRVMVRGDVAVEPLRRLGWQEAPRRASGSADVAAAPPVPPAAAQPWSPYAKLFSNAVKPANRAGFIDKAMAFLDKWGFDG